MSKYEVGKSVEAMKLNKRTGIPLVGHPVTIPYGAILDNVEEAGDYYKFSYLSENYQMKMDIVRGALHKLKAHGEGADEAATGSGSSSSPAERPPDKPALVFEALRIKGAGPLSRARVPGGWLVSAGTGVAFVPDAGHEWDGTSYS
ncbi:MAG TPA: hypothetical protein VM120_09300 [Bryobacteraceae bacterium]|nr:hypothetical protein [Bryobacteraceae bacterium]